LFDAAGNRKPLDANDPEQADLRKEWMTAYKANGGEVESDSAGHTTASDPVLPCERRPVVNPVMMATPISLDESPDEIEPEADDEEAEPEDSGQEDESPADDNDEEEEEEDGRAPQ
jgi:hypothetical protein